MRRFGWLVILVISSMSIAACAQLPGKPDLCRGGEPFEQPEYHPDRFLQSAQ